MVNPIGSTKTFLKEAIHNGQPKRRNGVIPDIEFGSWYQQKGAFGFTKKWCFAGHFAAIGSSPEIASAVSGTILQKTLFSTAEEQITMTLRINEDVWHDPNITEKILRKELKEPPICPPPLFTEKEKRFYCLVLFCETKSEGNGYRSNYLQTFWRYFKAVEKIYGEDRINLWGEYECQGAQYGREKRENLTGVIMRDDSWTSNHYNFYWLIVELGYRFAGIESDDMPRVLKENKVVTLGHQVFAIPAMHPKWGAAIIFQDSLSGDGWPFGLAPFEVSGLLIVNSSGRAGTPTLYGHGGKLHFKSNSGGRDTQGPAYIAKSVPNMNYQSVTDLI
uniref:Uncharacterized protein n=1 Tax=candidate division CPR3 bacterium TaxID=2268181 RepID=A0A7C4M0V3_UNCC3